MATSAVDELPDLKQILGSMIFAANRPLSVNDMRKCLMQVAETDKDAAVFGEVKGVRFVRRSRSLPGIYSAASQGSRWRRFPAGFGCRVWHPVGAG